MKRALLWIGLVAAAIGGLATAVGAPRPDEPPAVLATAAGEAITVDDFLARYGAYLVTTGVPDSRALRRTFLQNLLSSRLVLREARAAGIEEDPAYRERAAAVRDKLLIEAYAHHVLYDTLRVTEAELEALFVRANTTYRARHLFARTLPEAEALYARLQAGASFEALAAEVFEDTLLARNGGSLGTFGFDEMDPAFEEAVATMQPGEISAPVRTAQGYSIIQLQDRFTKAILTESEFAARRRALSTFALRRKRLRVRTEHARALEAALGLVFQEDVLGQLLGQVTGAALLADEPEVLEAFLARPLVTFGPPGQRQTWTADDFRVRARFTDEAQRARVRTRADLEAFIAGLVAREEMKAQALQRSLDTLSAFTDAFEEAIEDWVYAETKRRVLSGIVVPEDSLRAYYARHRAEFVDPARVSVGEILVETQAEAAALRDRLAQTPFEALARRFSLRPGADETGGWLGDLTPEELGPFADAVLAAGEGDVLGPMALPEGNAYVLLQVGPRREARHRTYEEARPDLEEHLRWRDGRAALRAYAEQLRERYPTTMNEELLASLALPGAGTARAVR